MPAADNNGPGTLGINGVWVNGDNFSLTSTSCSTSLQQGQSCYADVSYSPGSYCVGGAQYGTLYFSDSGTSGQQTVSLTGTQQGCSQAPVGGGSARPGKSARPPGGGNAGSYAGRPMRSLTAALLGFSLTLFTMRAGAQTPAPLATAPSPARAAAAPAAGTRPPAGTRPALPAHAANHNPAPPARTRAAAGRNHHWLRWAIIGVSAVLGVIAILAYLKNRCHQCPQPLP